MLTKIVFGFVWSMMMLFVFDAPTWAAILAYPIVVYGKDN